MERLGMQSGANDFIWEDGGSVFLRLKAQPRASRDEVGEVLGDRLKVKVRAAPVEGEANAAVMDLLRKILGCSRRDLEMVQGKSARTKVVKVRGMTAEEARRRLGG